MPRYQYSHGVVKTSSHHLSHRQYKKCSGTQILQKFCGTCEKLRSHFLLMHAGLHVGLPECRNGLHDSRLMSDVVAEGDPRAVPNSKDRPGASGVRPPSAKVKHVRRRKSRNDGKSMWWSLRQLHPQARTSPPHHRRSRPSSTIMFCGLIAFSTPVAILTPLRVLIWEGVIILCMGL